MTHPCPACGAPVPSNPRYPLAFCHACLDTAMDGNGRRLTFGNASLSGGLIWRYRYETDWHDAGHVACRIGAQTALISEARFGGVVAVPAPDGDFDKPPYKLVDLRQAQ